MTSHDTTRDTPTRSCQNCAKRERGAKITKLIREAGDEEHAKSQIRERSEWSAQLGDDGEEF